MQIQACELPPDALLRAARHGTYTDCYVIEMAGRVSQPEYVAAFYTTPLFKIERLLLKWLCARPSNDQEAQALAAGTLDAFAAWRVEARGDHQLLLADFTGRTRSWLMTANVEGNDGARTRLYFGSAVLPVVDARSGQARLGFLFRSLLGFHRFYSRALLRTASSRIARLRFGKE